MVGEYAPTGKDAVSAYLRDAELEGRPARSIATYRSSLSLLLASEEPLVSLNIRELLHERCQHLSSNSVISVLAAHRSFIRYALDQGWLQLDPLRGLKSPKKREVPHRFLTPSEVRQLWDRADDLLDRAALILLTLGLRAGEACAVKPSDVGRNAEGAYIRVRTQKGGTPRLLPPSQRLQRAFWKPCPPVGRCWASRPTGCGSASPALADGQGCRCIRTNCGMPSRWRGSTRQGIRGRYRRSWAIGVPP